MFRRLWLERLLHLVADDVEKTVSPLREALTAIQQIAMAHSSTDAAWVEVDRLCQVALRGGSS